MLSQRLFCRKFAQPPDKKSKLRGIKELYGEDWQCERWRLASIREGVDLLRAQHAIVDSELVDLPVEVWVSGKRRATDEVVASVAQVGRAEGCWGLLCNLRSIEIDGQATVANGDCDVNPLTHGQGIRAF